MSESWGFDGSLIDYVQNPNYYGGVYNGSMVVVLADDTMVIVPPRSVDIEYDESCRSYIIEECETVDGSDASLRIEHHHRNEDEVTHVVGTYEETWDREVTLPAARWGIEQMQEVGGDV